MKSARNKNHATSACVSCRQRKSKCDEVHPVCSSCAKKGWECEWTPDSDRRTARGRKCEDCAVWRVKCAELEARLAVLEGRPEWNLGQIRAEHAPRPLYTGQDCAARPPNTGSNAMEQRRFQVPLFPLHEEPIAGLHPEAESTVLSGSIDATYWLAAGSTASIDAVQYAELDALYDCRFATAPSGFLDGALDSYVGPELATERAQP